MTENAVKESRYYDASCYYRCMATQILDQNVITTTNGFLEKRWKILILQADIYYAYEFLFKYVVIFISFFKAYFLDRTFYK